MKKKAANRPLKYGEKTEMIHIRVPKSLKQKCKDLIKRFLKQYEV